MSAFRRIFATAILAGLLGGAFSALVHHFTTTPLILHAERYETAAPADGHRHGAALDRGLKLFAAAQAHGDEQAGAKEVWAPGDGLERTAYTLMSEILTAVGFALVLAACFSLSGRAITGPEGLLWGLGGFGAISLAPALGLPPEVPGSMAAELVARQTWWFFCVASSVAGLWILVFRKGMAWIAAGIFLLVLPHAVGAPQPAAVGGRVPPEIAGHFVAASLVTAAVFWCVLGWLSGTFWQRFTARL
jgi:cobalt transporter subunit CbtA